MLLLWFVLGVFGCAVLGVVGVGSLGVLLGGFAGFVVSWLVLGLVAFSGVFRWWFGVGLCWLLRGCVAPCVASFVGAFGASLGVFVVVLCGLLVGGFWFAVAAVFAVFAVGVLVGWFWGFGFGGVVGFSLGG